MHDNLKRWTAAGLVIIMLLVGFFAEYTHRHVKLVIGQTSIAQATGQQPGQSARQKISHDCFVCQLTSVAVEVTLLFTPWFSTSHNCGLLLLNLSCPIPSIPTISCREKQKLLNRVRRIRGQVDAIEKALTEERECSSVLQTIAACRGAINGLMAEVIEGHIRFHVINPDLRPTSEQAHAAQEVIDVINTYLK